MTGQRSDNLANYNNADGNFQGDESVKDELAVPGGIDFSNCETQVGRFISMRRLVLSKNPGH